MTCRPGGGLRTFLVAAAAAAVASLVPARAHAKGLPITFEPNVGQAPAGFDFVARGASHAVALHAGGAVLIVPDEPAQRAARGRAGATRRESVPAPRRATSLSLRLAGSSAGARAVTEQPVATKSHYFLGNDPSRWRPNVPHVARVVFEDVYEGVDLAWHGSEGELEHDFLLDAGVPPARIRFTLEGARKVELLASGDLVARLEHASVRLRRPIAWQVADGARRPVEAAFALDAATGSIGYALGPHDAALPLVIDPVVEFATYLGGSEADSAWAVAVDPGGDVIVAGTTGSADFPSAGGVQPAYAGGTTFWLGGDAFVTRLAADGASVVFSTFLGGSAGPDIPGGEAALALALDAAGNILVAGATSASSFPVTPGAFQPAHGGAMTCGSSRDELCSAGFVAKLDPTGGTLLFSTYLGGAPNGTLIGVRFTTWGDYDTVMGLAVDAGGRAHLSGLTHSTMFPVTAGAPQPVLAGEGDGFVAVLDAAGSQLDFATYFGGPDADEARDVAVSPSGTTVVAGVAGAGLPTTVASFQPAHGGQEDGFAATFDTAAPALAWATYLGGKQPDLFDEVEVDANGNVFVAGMVSSADMPTASAAQATKGGQFDAWVGRLSPDGTSLAYGTWFGGGGLDEVGGLALDAAGRAVIAGITTSRDVPLVDAVPLRADCDPYDGCLRDVVVAWLQPDGASLCWSEAFGGDADDGASAVAVSASGDVVVVGYARDGFGTTAGAFQETAPSVDASAFAMRIGGFTCP